MWSIQFKTIQKFLRSTRRSSATNKHQGCCSQIKSKSKTTTEKVVPLYAKKFGTPWTRTVHKEFGTISRKRCYWKFAESGCPIFRATTPLSRGQLRSKRHGKLSIHFAATQATIETVFRIIVSANPLSLYGAVANMCEEYESRHDRSGRPDKVMGQSIVLSEIKTEVPLESDPAYQNFLLQQI